MTTDAERLRQIANLVRHIPGDGVNFTIGEQNRAEEILAIAEGRLVFHRDGCTGLMVDQYGRSPKYAASDPVWAWMCDDGEWVSGVVSGTPQMFPELRAVRFFPGGGITTFPTRQLAPRVTAERPAHAPPSHVDYQAPDGTSWLHFPSMNLWTGWRRGEDGTWNLTEDEFRAAYPEAGG